MGRLAVVSIDDDDGDEVEDVEVVKDDEVVEVGVELVRLLLLLVEVSVGEVEDGVGGEVRGDVLETSGVVGGVVAMLCEDDGMTAGVELCGRVGSTGVVGGGEMVVCGILVDSGGNTSEGDGLEGNGSGDEGNEGTGGLVDFEGKTASVGLLAVFTAIDTEGTDGWPVADPRALEMMLLTTD